MWYTHLRPEVDCGCDRDGSSRGRGRRGSGHGPCRGRAHPSCMGRCSQGMGAGRTWLESVNENDEEVGKRTRRTSLEKRSSRGLSEAELSGSSMTEHRPFFVVGVGVADGDSESVGTLCPWSNSSGVSIKRRLPGQNYQQSL